MFYKKNRGFTLVEIVIVIIIIGILAALAFPQFSKTKEHAIGKEAMANLKLIAAAERIYRIEVNAYYPSPASASPVSNITDINNYLRLSITETNWRYSVTDLPSGNTFSSTASRVSGLYPNCIYTITDTTDPTPTNCP